MLDKKAMGVKHWPEGERLRERPTDHGPATLANAQLLAISIKSCKAGHTAPDLAVALLEGFLLLLPARYEKLSHSADHVSKRSPMVSIVHPCETIKAAISESAAAVTSFIIIRAAISNRSWKTFR